MSDSQKPLDQKVLEWLGKHGYPLEMAVASEFSRLDLDVTQSGYYEDPETQQPREIDVVAEYVLTGEEREIIFNLVFAVECKKSNVPWVSFRSTTEQEPNLASFGWVRNLSGWEVKEQLDEQSGFATAGPNVHKANLSTGLAVANFSNKESNKNGDAAYKALLSSCKSAQSLVDKADRRQFAPANNLEVLIATIAMPLVVLDAKLFEASLDEEGTVQVEEVRETIVAFRYPVSKKEYRSPIQVRVMTVSGFAQFVESLRFLDEMLSGDSSYLDKAYDTFKSSIDPGKLMVT